MHRIIEQTAVPSGMVKTPHPSSHRRDGLTWRISPSPPTAQELPSGTEARKETPTPTADAHHPARFGGSLAHRDLPRALLFAHHRLRGRRSLRWGGEGGLRRPEAARPGGAAGKKSERARRAFGRRGFAHRPRLAALALELQAHRPPTVRGACRHPGKPGDGAPRAPPARLPLEEGAPRRAR